MVKYHETVWSDVFPGNAHTVHCFRPAVVAVENALELAPQRHRRTIWRLDGGAGSERQLHWLMERNYQVVAKGMNSHRAHTLSRQVSRWDPYRDIWLGEVPSPTGYPRPVRVFVKRRLEKGRMLHNYYVSTLKLPSKRLYLTYYDARGGAEVEQFRNDKQGLSLAARRKRSFLGQKAYVLLTDLAHNLLADFHHRALKGTRFESFGLKRIVRDLLATPGRLVFEAGQLQRVELLSLKLFSKDLLSCLERYCSDE